MRLLAVLKNEMRFAYKYGIVFLYLLCVALYSMIVAAVPASSKEAVGALLIYTDPAAMGLFFMGAMVLLENSQRVHCSLAVTPMTVWEYMAGKVIALLLLGTAVGLAVGAFAGISPASVLLCVPLASALFSLCGLIVATWASTLNRFLIYSVGFEIVICLPAVLYLFAAIEGGAWLLHPGVAAASLLLGERVHTGIALLSLTCWTVLTALLCKRAVTKYFLEMGGAKA